MHVSGASAGQELAAPSAAVRRSDRGVLAASGIVLAVGGVGCLAFTAWGLLHSLPPEVGHTLAILGSAALGMLLLGTGFLYLMVGRTAREMEADLEGLVVSTRRVPVETDRVPWGAIASVGLRRWDLSPWVGKPRFYVLELSVKEGLQGWRCLVHVERPSQVKQALRGSGPGLP